MKKKGLVFILLGCLLLSGCGKKTGEMDVNFSSDIADDSEDSENTEEYYDDTYLGEVDFQNTVPDPSEYERKYFVDGKSTVDMSVITARDEEDTYMYIPESEGTDTENTESVTVTPSPTPSSTPISTESGYLDPTDFENLKIILFDTFSGGEKYKESFTTNAWTFVSDLVEVTNGVQDVVRADGYYIIVSEDLLTYPITCNTGEVDGVVKIVSISKRIMEDDEP